MQNVLRYPVIVVLLALSTFPVSYADSLLAPPKLGEVMQENEKIQRIQRIQIRKNKSVLSPVLSSVEIFSYHTIETGKAITLSKYDNIDLWVQEIDLSK
jgi:hypothetical protein